MYLRWQSRKRRSPRYGKGLRRSRVLTVRADSGKQDVHWAAVLAESTRVKGKPVQRHVAYLGGITESAIEIVVAQRCLFWQHADEQLSRLGNRTSAEYRARVEAALAKRVPRPTKEQFEECERRRRSYFES